MMRLLTSWMLSLLYSVHYTASLLIKCVGSSYSMLGGCGIGAVRVVVQTHCHRSVRCEDDSFRPDPYESLLLEELLLMSFDPYDPLSREEVLFEPYESLPESWLYDTAVTKVKGGV
ncbi:hypothetical protein C8R43DRAFT_1005912, partial [Mycena crocata]